MKQKKLTKKEITEIEYSEPIESIEGDLDVKTFLAKLPLNLDLAGIFFVSALVNLNQGRREFQKLQKALETYNKIYKIQEKNYPKNSEEFITNMLSKIRNIEVLYEPVLRYFSTVKILLVCCAETFVNEIAAVALKGRKLDEFDKLSLIGKWLFIQDLLQLDKKFNLDRKPLQGFNLLVKERNKLVHFKGIRKTLLNLEIPDYINELKLAPKDCEDNLESVRELIRTISLNWRGSYGPDWLYTEEKNFRNPCFYLGNRESSTVLYSDIYDKDRIN